VNLIEPKKEEVLRYLGILRETTSSSSEEEEEGCNRNEPTRECEVCGIEVGTGSSYLIEVRLEQSAATVSKPPMKLPDGTHSTIAIEEVDEAERIAKNDPNVISLCQQVGISKEQIFGDGWAMGFDSRFGNFKRLQQCLM
jgi:primary-amine oxidase